MLISDNGPGIDNPLELLIQPFFTTKIDGMGLGLFICNRTANNMGLKLELFEEKRYSRFTFWCKHRNIISKEAG